MVNLILDSLFQMFQAAEDAVASAGAGNVAEPAIDNVQRRIAGRYKCMRKRLRRSASYGLSYACLLRSCRRSESWYRKLCLSEG